MTTITTSSLNLEEKAGSGYGPRRSLRIAIVTENFLPKVDGVTRTIAMLLQHLAQEGHTALVMGPESGMTSYAGHEVIGTKGIPLLGIYKGLKLNFLRPKFITALLAFKPDVIQFVDPIWLCAQAIPAIEYWLPNVPLLSSYHTNLGCYATLFGFSWLSSTVWSIQRNLNGRCALTYCPSPSTARMLESKDFQNVRLWPRGVDTDLFRPSARDIALRESWGVTPASSLGSTVTQEKIVLLYVGRISWEKNLRLLVEACRGLEKADGTRPACQLVFVGEGPSRSELEVLCASYGLDAVFTGHLSGPFLAAAYASADIFAFPSWTETFGQVVLEALCSGTPVVGLRAEGVCDLVQDGATGLLLDLDDLLPPSSTPVLSEKASAFKPLQENPHLLLSQHSTTFPVAVSLYRNLLVDLATNHDRRKSFGTAARAYASTKTWHDAMEQIVDGFRELAGPAVPNPLALSRSPTLEIDLDVVSHSPNDEEVLASSTATTKRTRVGRVMRLGAVLRRSGGQLREGSMHWTRRVASAEDQLLLKRATHGWTSGWIFIMIALSYLLYLTIEVVSTSATSQRLLTLLNA